MYRVFCDGYKLYDYRTDKYKILNAILELELNKTGSFSFVIFPDHPNFNRLRKMKSIIIVYQGDDVIFRGRILDTEEGFYNQVQVTCEGELAFLIDSIIRPYSSQENPWVGTPEEYLQKLINEHNSQVDEYKHFRVGIVNVPTGNSTGNITRYDTDYNTAWKLLSEKLVGSLGGYLSVRYEEDGNYIDYLSDFNVLSNQKITFGKNLLDIKKTTKGDDIVSAIIPLGAKAEGDSSRTTIADVNDGQDYIFDQDAVDTYGWVFKTVVWDEITDPARLKKEAEEYLASMAKLTSSIEFTAADLSGIENVNAFRLGRYVTVKDKRHGFDDSLDFLIKKLSIDILNPTNNKLTVGTTYQTFTESSSANNQVQGQIVQKLEEVEQNVQGFITEEQMNTVKREVIEQTTSSVNQSASEIMTQVAQEYYLQNDADELVSSINTRFEQRENEFEFRFNQFTQDLQNVADGADAKFADISKYIRFVDGNIILGEDGNELILNIQNDRISFMESGAEVAYFSNRKLHVLDGNFINSLKIGNFSFIPRTNGNLSFNKVT